MIEIDLTRPELTKGEIEDMVAETAAAILELARSLPEERWGKKPEIAKVLKHPGFEAFVAGAPVGAFAVAANNADEMALGMMQRMMIGWKGRLIEMEKTAPATSFGEVDELDQE